MSDRLKIPPERDFGFYQRRKHDKWRAVAPPAPALEGPVADSHAHIHMLPEPAWELVRCAANNVRFVCEICDPSEDELDVPEAVEQWTRDARAALRAGKINRAELQDVDARLAVEEGGAQESPRASESLELLEVPEVRISAGVHPHNAKLYDDEVEMRLRAWLAAPQTVVLGEIGLDYHYDLSPRDVQRDVFRRQIRMAKELGLPIALHLRGSAEELPSGEPAPSNAHAEAFEILREEGFPERGTILHCCALPPDELRPWVEAGCYIAYGGAITFKNADAAREGARIVPENRLLLETDSPYMTPEPMRGAACTPAHVVFTAARLAEVRGIAAGPDREQFLARLFENTARFFGV